MAGPSLVACQHCASLHERRPIEGGAVAACARCGSELYRQSRLSLEGWLALTTAALLVFAIANAFPVAILNITGLTVKASFPEALFLTWEQGHWLLAIMTGLFGFWLPLTQLLFMLWALVAIKTGRLPGDFPYGMRMLEGVARWSMIPVLMLGMLVAIVKFAGLASLTVGPGVWALATLTVLMTALSRLSAQHLWLYAEEAKLVPVAHADTLMDKPVSSCLSCGFVQAVDPQQQDCRCQRCNAPLFYRKPNTTSRVWAFVIAATIMYIPANILPVMRLRSPTGASEHTILGGVIELWQMGSWALALIVFVASVVVPMTKLLALIVLLIRRRWMGRSIQRQRTRLYELIEFIGQWSMLDVFVVILLTAMANFPGISQVLAGPGAASFGVVVVLTMFATLSFDPRQGWDRDPQSPSIHAVQFPASEVSDSHNAPSAV